MEQISGASMNIVADNIEKLKGIFPEVFCEDKVDFERLQEMLGSYIEDKEERYRFEWNGKSKAIRIAQTPSTGTLRPCKEESKEWDTTQNLYIEGDNLEVLKLLQKSYQNKIKMIYIDPPYNTGNDFIYKDDYKDNLWNYLAITGQLDDDGKRISTNSESGGRFHTEWLNMIYPRLRLAKNLLKDDGVIFISIDDNEITNLKKICDEIYGENNFVGEFIILSNPRGSQASKHLANVHEYVLMYCKDINKLNVKGYKKSDENTAEYKEIDENGLRYRLLGLRQRGGAWRREDRPNMFYPVYVNEKTGEVSLEKRNEFNIEVLPKRPTGEESRWTWGKEKFVEDIRLLVGKKINRVDDENSWDIYRKDYLVGENGEEKTQKPKTIWDEKEMNYQNAKVQIKELFGNSEVFDFPKPTFIVKKCFEMMGANEDIVLDFFSGSGTTAQAVMEMNIENNTNNKFILVQIPEKISSSSQAAKFECENICDISKKRINLAGESIIEKNKDKENAHTLDIGFKVFKLDSSNIKKWNPDYDELEQSFEDILNNFVTNRSEEDVVYEIMLKYGIDLTYPVEEKVIDGKKVYSIGFGALIICLDDNITLDVINGIVELKEELEPEICRVVFKDNGFATDSVKTNSIEILKRNNIKEVMSI